MLASGEYRSKLVNGFYLRFLRRAADSPSLAFFSNLIQGGGTDEKAIAAIVSSPEYYALFNPAVTVVTTLTAKGEVHTTIPRAAKLALTVLKVVPPPHPVRAAAFGAPSTKVVGVVQFGRHRKGRVTIHWNRKVGGKRLRRGSYIVLLRALSGRKLIYVSDALPFKVR